MRKVMVLIPVNGEYARGLWRGIVQYAHAHAPFVFFDESPPYLVPSSPEQRLAHMRAWDPQGVICEQVRADEIRALGLPTIVVCGPRYLPAEQFQVRTDDEAIGCMAAEYLLGLGFKRLAFCGMAGIDWSEGRGKAFARHAATAGIEVHSYALRNPHSADVWYTEEAALGDWLAALPTPVGLLACNDERACMLADICRRRGIRVPDQIAILGVDNDEHICNRAYHPLSSVALDTESAGYKAAAMLDALIGGKPVESRIVVTRPVRVVPRPSTDLIAVDDQNLVKALRFIRDNCNRPIHVRDVAAAAGLSQRLLQDRFRNAFGRTMLQEIHHTRAAFIARLLSETDLSMQAVAKAAGYETDTHLARFFARQTGVSPSVYRRQHRKG